LLTKKKLKSFLGIFYKTRYK